MVSNKKLNYFKTKHYSLLMTIFFAKKRFLLLLHTATTVATQDITFTFLVTLAQKTYSLEVYTQLHKFCVKLKAKYSSSKVLVDGVVFQVAQQFILLIIAAKNLI